ncbi:MAG: hypothetical protein MUC33_04725 [Desulfobacterales bacterium]|jgi:hypothetical protein|nr:hypothetical protein [Desulfobacterales bacterium]
MNYDWAFARRIRCRREDQQQCLLLISDILLLTKKARSLGLLSLIETIEACPNRFLKKGLQLIVDGEKPHTVREILEISIMAGGFRGRELLERCIILEGLMGIQAGLNPKSIQELLLSFIGEEVARTYETEFGDGGGGNLDRFLKNLEQSQPPSAAQSPLSLLFSKLGDDEIRQCLKEISTLDLAKALKNMNAKTQMRIFNTLPKPGALFLRETLEQMGRVPPSAVAEAQERIEAAIRDIRRRTPPPQAAAGLTGPTPV